MSYRNVSSLGVGDVLFSAEFCLKPQDVVAWEHSRVLDGHDDRARPHSHLARPPAVASPVPEGLVFARAIDAVGRSGLVGARLEQTSVGNLRALRPARVGDVLSCVATVRYCSERAGARFMTLAIQVRSRDCTVAEVEVGVEIEATLVPVHSVSHAA